MTAFALQTTWSIPAPQDLVWFHLVDTEKWPQWWGYVVTVAEISAGKPTGTGNVRQYLWRTRLPYTLSFTLHVVEVRPYRYLAVDVSGDLEGTGACDIRWDKATQHTQINFTWCVTPCKPWMRRSLRLLKPVFTWNHSQVMKNGEQGLIRYLSSLQHPL